MSVIHSTEQMKTSSTPRQQNVLLRFPLLTYSVMAYVITLLAIIIGMLLVTDPGISDLLNTIGAFAPSIAAVIVTALTGGKAGLVQLLRRIVQWRVHPLWYLIVLIGIPLITMLGASLMYGTTHFSALIQQWPVLLMRYITYLLTSALLVPGLAEEVGWRGFALPRLQQRYGPLVGTLLLGIIWSFWHLPNALGPGGLYGFALLVVSAMLSAFFYTWVYNNTGGSILLMMLIHASRFTSTRLIANLVPIENMTHFMDQLHLIDIVTMGGCAVLIIVFTRGRLSYTPKQAAADAEMQPAQAARLTT